MPPPEAKISAQPKGLNLMSPTIPPPTKVAVRDGDDMDPNPAPAVETSMTPEPSVVAASAPVAVSAPEASVTVSDIREDDMQQAIDTAPPNAKPDVETRIANLEAALASLRADYDRIIPTFKTLSVNTERLVGLMNQLEAEQKLSSVSAASISPAAGVETPVSAPVMAMDSVSADGGALVRGVRFGMHPDKARVVIDVSSPTDYSYDIDNIEKVMMISLPHANWKTVAQRMNIGSDIIESWSYQPGPDGGSALILQLKGAAKVIGRNALPANGGKGPRIYIDIAKS